MTVHDTAVARHPPHHPGMDRRRFLLTSMAGAFAAPLAAEAQAGTGLRIGVLWSAGEDAAPFIGAFRQGLRELGNKGQDAALEIRNADGRPERLPGLAAELVRLKVDVILAQSNPAIAAAQKATTSIPIVMVLASEPVALGFVASLARPGGNITGLSIQTPDTAGKRLQILKEAVPNLSRVAALLDPDFVGGRELLLTVAKYMRRPSRSPSPTWRAFLEAHPREIVAIDFFVVPTLTFRLLFAFIVLRHDRRELVHVDVTDHPTAAWTAQQIVETFPTKQPRGIFFAIVTRSTATPFSAASTAWAFTKL